MDVIKGRERDLGALRVQRVLPHISRKMVGPFIFFDHMGPAEFHPGTAMDVRPHPHINLATVTYLFEGAIEHRDSLGSDQLIEPGAINWMTSGRGIVHSERTPDHLRSVVHRVNGIQLWVALPIEEEERAASFSHHPSSTLPLFEKDGVKGKLLLGKGFGVESPVPVLSDMIYAEIKLAANQSVSLPAEGRELSVYVVTGKVKVGSEIAEPYTMIAVDGDLSFIATEDSHVMVLGGKNIGPRFIEWNFVSSRKERIDEVKAEWTKGPREGSVRFPPIPGDDREFIPLP